MRTLRPATALALALALANLTLLVLFGCDLVDRLNYTLLAGVSSVGLLALAIHGARGLLPWRSR